LSIEPQPAPRFTVSSGEKSPYDTTAVDLHLADYYSLPRHAPGVVIDLGQPGVVPTLEALTDQNPIPATGYLLEPNEFILTQTLEIVHLRLPTDLDEDAAEKPPLAARVEGKSSRARFGLFVHFTAPTVHAGYHGRITLEMINLGKWPLLLKPNIPICQLIIEEVRGSPAESESQFQGQLRPTGSR
jgi:dCTP deaminase